MGEAPAFFVDVLQKGYGNGFDIKSKGGETAILMGNRTYVIGGACEESPLSIGVQIFDQSTGEWIYPTVLGTKPKTCKGLSAVLLSEDRILITKNGSTPDDFAWFLEVDTQYVRQQKKILGTDVVAWSKGVRGYAEKPIVISGPSGSYGEGWGHYHFIERSSMEKEIEDGKFLEFASVHGNLYGTSVEAVEVVADDGKRCILDIDVQGARSVRASSLEAIFIFVCPPSMEELEKRLRARGTETEEQVLKRLKNAKAEIEQGQSSGIFDHMLYNDNLEECYKSLKKLLGLDGTVTAPPKSSPKVVDLPMDHSVAKIDHRIIINSKTPELGKASTNMIVLDVSSLKGGAPGRTRGLDIYTMDSFLDGLAGINH
ncbi:hypothetical protein GBA52_024197 [Prunus armeniaca]|nr:hypothetical protein GBA52_024197 [Prunus armeniaca]